MLSLEEAQACLLADLEPLGDESVDLLSACGRVIAETITAARALPAFDNSEMDGYALIAVDTEAASQGRPVTLKIIDTVPAGSMAAGCLTRGTAIRIFTGAPIPSGADAVIMQEMTHAAGCDVEILEPVTTGQHVRRAGADFARGALVVRAGQVVGPGEIGAIGSQGRTLVRVARRPRVAVIPTGNEIVEIDRDLAPGQVANSNSHMLAAAVATAGGVVLRGPIAPDEPGALADILTEAANSADLIVTSGGVSVGDFDHVIKILEETGDLQFWRVAVKPGKPVAYGRFAGVPLIGLPGNPASTFVGFELFVRPALLMLAGHKDLFRPRRRALLVAPVRPNPDRRAFLRGRLEVVRDGSLLVDPVSTQSSAHLRSLIGVNALIDVPPGRDTIARDQVVDILDLSSMPISGAC